MRHSVLTLAVAAVGGFAVAGCGSGPNNGGGGDMGRDMANVGGVGMDMASVKLNCLGIGFCIASCPQGTPVQTCFTNCAKMATQSSNKKFGDAFNCGQAYCAPDPDSGATAKCVRTPDPSDPTNPNKVFLCAPGQTYAECMANGPSICNSCLQDAIGDPLLGDGTTPPTGTCTNMSSPDCKGGALCATVMNACIGDP